jgi:hypothetical protein
MRIQKKVKRRDFLRSLGAGAGVAIATSGPIVHEASAADESDDEKRKARYEADSPDVQSYYRVNRYPAK